MRKMSQNNEIEKLPPPNYYDPKIDYTTHNNGTITFGKEIRGPNKIGNSKSYIPGPGTYSLGQKI